MAAIPKVESSAETFKVTLRASPQDLSRSELKEMVKKHNFFAKSLNETGDLANDFVDNGDGTITDKITGLMWQKEGSSSQLFYWEAEKYVSRRNEARYLGYNDWRIPTVEELCSLLEVKVNSKMLHIDSLFDPKQSACWSVDAAWGTSLDNIATPFNFVDFAEGSIDYGATIGTPSYNWTEGLRRSYVRLVRTIK